MIWVKSSYEMQNEAVMHEFAPSGLSSPAACLCAELYPLSHYVTKCRKAYCRSQHAADKTSDVEITTSKLYVNDEFVALIDRG